MADGSVIIEAKLDGKNAEQGLDSIKKKAENVGESFKATGAKMQAIGAKMTVAGGIMVGVGKKLVEAANVQAAAETKLIEVYRTRMGVNEKAAKSTMKLASALQQQGVVGDEVTLSGAQQLATFAKYPGTVDKLLPAMDNLLVQQKGLNATTDDATNIANLMGKALMGQTGALRRCGITFSKEQEEMIKYGTEEERAATLADVITENVGNMNSEFAKTDAGKIQQAKNTIGDMEEELGAQLLPTLATVAKYVSKNVLPKVQSLIDWFGQHPAIAKFVVALAGILVIGGPIIGLLGMMVSGMGSLLGAAGKLGGGILSKLIPQLGATATAEATAGASAGAAAGNVLRLGAGFLMMGAGIGLAAAGLWLIAKAAIALAAAGWPAIACMAGMVGILAGLIILVTALGPAFVVGAAGMLLFGAGVALVGIGALAAAAGMALLAGKLPTIASYALPAAAGILALGAAMMGATAGMIAGGLAATGAAVGFGVLAAAMILLRVGTKAVAVQVKAIATNATIAAKKLKVMQSSVKTCSTGLKAIGSTAKSAMNTLTSAMSNAAGKCRTAGTNAGRNFTNGLKSALAGAPSAAKSAANKVAAAFKNVKIKIPKPKVNPSVSWVNYAKGKVSVSLPKIRFNKYGAILKKATLFGMAGGQFQVGGEAGPEAVAPITTLQEYIRDAVADQNAKLLAKIGNIGRFGSISGSSNTVNQTINFNQPVTTPAETARALKMQATYGLAGA